MKTMIQIFAISGYGLLTGLSKNRRDDGTGRSIPPAAGGHIVALMTRWGGRRGSLTGDDGTSNMFLTRCGRTWFQWWNRWGLWL